VVVYYYYPLFVIVYTIIDEICRGSLHFIRTCSLRYSSLIRFVVQYGALGLCSQSILGQNVLFCPQHYHRSINGVIYNQVNSCIITFALLLITRHIGS